MAFNNVIVSGFKKAGKLIGQGFSKLSAGVFAKICRIDDKPYLCQELSAVAYLNQKLSTKEYLCQKLSTEGGL